jgi:hypothetical protein
MEFLFYFKIQIHINIYCNYKLLISFKKKIFRRNFQEKDTITKIQRKYFGKIFHIKL